MKRFLWPCAFILFASCTASNDQPGLNVTEERTNINHIINQWHRDAANADTNYFTRMAQEAIYIGTDKTEHWTKSEFTEFAAPYFQKGQAWDFTPLERNIFFSENGEVAWFDELLATWMGTCRSSGVIIREGGQWKISHYHLSLAVPNEKMREVIELLAKQEKQG